MMAYKTNRVVLIGTGFVGASYAFALINQELVEELVLIDVNEDKAEGEAMDLNHGVPFSDSPIKVWKGDYNDCREADIVCITAGISQSQEETRLSGVEKNNEIAKSIVDNVMGSKFDGIFVISTNPVDIITYAVWKYSGFPKERVIGTGTLLDTSRYLYELSEYFNIDPSNINGYIIGEHGDSQVAALSSTTIGGRRITDIINADDNYSLSHLESIADRVRDSADAVIGRKGSTYYGIGMGLAKLTKAILRNENTILPVSAYLEGEYDFENVFAGVPAVINRQGLREVVEIDLDDSEKEKLNSSIKIIKNTLDTLFGESEK